MSALIESPWPYSANSSAAQYLYTLPPGYPLATDDPIFVSREIFWALGQHAKIWSGLLAEGYSPATYFRDMVLFFRITQSDLLLLAAYVIGWTILRVFLFNYVFCPLGRWVRLRSHDVDKCAESAFKFLAYSVMLLNTIFALFGDRTEAFWSPLETLRNCQYTDYPALNWYICAPQISFYIFSLFSTIFLEEKRKDATAYVIHHIVTSTVVGLAMVLGRWQVVALTTLIDVTDIFLEFGKICVYMRKRHGAKDREIWAKLASISAVSFAISWVIFRLWLYWTKVLRATIVGILIYPGSHFPVPFAVTGNIMLILVYLLNWYWFTFIINFVIRALKGGDVEDDREYDTDTETEMAESVKKET